MDHLYPKRIDNLDTFCRENGMNFEYKGTMSSFFYN